MDEFDLISSFFKPLARDFPGSLDLSDDAAVFAAPPGSELVVTKDAISEGVHFFGSEEPALIARKLLRVNISDLAAMGATPAVYFLALMLPRDISPAWVKSFAQGLMQDQTEYHMHLAGGDTISTLGPMSASLTAIGHVKSGKALRRSGAKIGDSIYVSGTLGDSALGLTLLKNTMVTTLPQANQQWLKERYFLPQPRLALGQKLTGIAHAAMDISDGLLQDLEHICTASGTGAIVNRQALPLSEPATALLHAHPELGEKIYSGGDDYELLFTAPAQHSAALQSLASELNVRITAIGTITEAKDVTLRDEKGQDIAVTRKGYSHLS